MNKSRSARAQDSKKQSEPHKRLLIKETNIRSSKAQKLSPNSSKMLTIHQGRRTSGQQAQQRKRRRKFNSDSAEIHFTTDVDWQSASRMTLCASNEAQSTSYRSLSATTCGRSSTSAILVALLVAIVSDFGSKVAQADNNNLVVTTSTPPSNDLPQPPIWHPTIQASFSTPSQAINITHVTYDPLFDAVYLGATNSIYQLSGSDLTEKYQQSTGPVLDNPSCGITECHGYEDHMKHTQNVNKILVIDYQHQKLLACGSTKQGACRRYQLNNIAQQEDLISMAVAANDDNSSTYAFIAPARYTFDPSTAAPLGPDANNKQQQQVLYVATTYTKVGQSRDLLVPAIGSRILDDGPNLFKLYENSFLDSARIDINSHLRDYFLVNYLYGFASSNYIYFVTVQKKATSRDYEELGYHTRLARICITDSSFNSYTEVDLKCMPNKKRSGGVRNFFSSAHLSENNHQPHEYPLLQDAMLVDAGSQLLRSLTNYDPIAAGSPDDTKVLLGVFSSAKDHTQHAGEHSALCAFSLSQIEDRFNDNIHSCYTGKMSSRNMEYIAGNVQECPKSGQGGNVVNFCHETLKINGTIPIVSEASIQFYNTTLTAITATSHINTNSKNIYSYQLANEMADHNISKFPSSSQQTLMSVASSNQNAGSQSPHTVVFMGTSDGHIKKILLNNASNGIEFEDVQLDSNPILSDLHLHSSGQHLIAATPYKVMKVPTHNCTQYTNCRECSQSRNPYCGWCSLKRSCTTRNECLPGGPGEAQATVVAAALRQPIQLEPSGPRSLKWISTDSASKCIDLLSIVPDKIPITSTGKVELHIERLPRLPREHNYKCIFDRREQTIATPTAVGLSCSLPKVMHRPKIQPGKDHTIVELAVRSSEANTDFLNGKITFFECQLHTSCKDCLSTNWGCSWCQNENICLFNTSKCERGPAIGLGDQAAPTTLAPLITISNGASERSSLSLTTLSSNAGLSLLTNAGESFRTGRTANTIGQVSQCPSFDVGYKQDILIADGSERGLTIRVKNMPQLKGNVQCLVEIEDDKIPLRARIEDDRIICANFAYSYAAEVGSLMGQLKVVYSDNNILLDRTNFTLYKCRLLGASLNRPDCSLCQHIESRFNCTWCGSVCRHRAQCAVQDRLEGGCPPTRLDSVYPSSGFAPAGTKVTFEGTNIGQSFEDIASPVLVEQIFQNMANSSEPLPYLRPVYPPQYVDKESENLSTKISSYLIKALLMVFYTTVASLLLLIIYSLIFIKFAPSKYRRGSYFDLEHRRVLTKMETLEKSIRSETKLAAMTLRGDLNELIRHIDLSGIPLLNPRDYIIKVFFPGINNHPLLNKSASSGACQNQSSTINLMSLQQQQHLRHNQPHQHHIGSSLTVQHPLKTSSDFPMENFERLILTKPFLIAFVNTLEMQPSFNIRDKVNVASLIMVVLIERLEYATDVMKTLLFQLVERSVAEESSDSSVDSFELDKKNSSRLTKRASNLLGALPIKRGGSRAVDIGKAVGGSASSLMASTTVAAQMLLSKVGNKTSPLQPGNMGYLSQSQLASSGSQYFSTTAFNRRNPMVDPSTLATRPRLSRKDCKINNQGQESLLSQQSSTHLMLRRTDSVVEKMLTNWLALNMQEYFHGEVGRSLYLMFEAIKTQLERGPVDAVSGDAYYSLSESKLLYEPNLQFQVVNLYVIVDTSILQPNDGFNNTSSNSNNNSSLLLDPSILPCARSTPFYGECDSSMTANRSIGNTMTMALRVLDCDTISQVKGKILSAIYRNSPYSSRRDIEEVELGLRQQAASSNVISHQHPSSIGDNQYMSIVLQDEDPSSTLTYNGLRRLNTLRHYGVTEQAIMTLQRSANHSASRARQTAKNRSATLSEMLDDRYNSNNPYSEIQYGSYEAQGQVQPRASVNSRSNRSWHLVQHEKGLAGNLPLIEAQSDNSTPASHSPCMMLLGGETVASQVPVADRNQNLKAQSNQQQQYYHPSSSSTSSTGNVMDTNSTSANSSSMNVTNLLMKSRCDPQPIYCQIGSVQSQHGGGSANSNYYCQVGANGAGNHLADYNQGNQLPYGDHLKATCTDESKKRETNISRMLATKGTVQEYVDNFFTTILNAKPSLSMLDDGLPGSGNQVLCGSDFQSTLRKSVHGAASACPPAVKWLFDLLDEAALENGITDPSVIHSWKSNAFLLRFWVNIIKNPNYILDIEKTNTLDANLSVIAQTLMDSCSAQSQKLTKDSACNKLIFAKDAPHYRSLVKRFYQDISSMRPVSDLEMAKQMDSLSIANANRFDTSLALKELCVYAVNYGVELMGALNNDFTCRQMDLPQQLEQCFRSFTIFEAYR